MNTTDQLVAEANALARAARVAVTVPRAADMGGPSSDILARRIRNEYLEMPGLSLTLQQAQRMWQLDLSECEELLAKLVDSGFLAQSTSGAFVRSNSGRAGA